jgi:hypothetical protein
VQHGDDGGVEAEERGADEDGHEDVPHVERLFGTPY